MEQILNLETVESMFAIAGPGDRFAFELYEVFVAQSELVVNALLTAAEQGDVVQVKRLAHRLKGSAANLGANALSTKAASVEHSLQDIEIAPASLLQDAQEIKTLFATTCQEVTIALRRF